MFTFIKHSLLIPCQYVLIICLLWLGFSFEAYAGPQQSALVIGNNWYEVGELSHSVQNNANDIAKALEKKGFEVTLLYNQSLRQMDDAIRKFGKRLFAKKGIGLFYFSGYATQVNGKNYLLPINNARIKDEDDIEDDTISLDKILKKMRKTGSDLNIIILDVSPDTPYLEPQYKSEKRGLAKIVVTPPGTFIEYATAPNSSTFRPGLYSKHLIKEIQVGGKINNVFMRVRKAVKIESCNQQIPWHQVSPKKVFCFGNCITEIKDEKRWTFSSCITGIKDEKRRTAEQKLNLNDLEKKFIIWALKRHFRRWEYPIPDHPEFNNEIREKLEQFSGEQGLSPSRFVSSAVISKLKEKTGFSILPQYEDARRFCHGVVAVKLDGRWGLIDTKNHWVLSPTYEDVGACRDGYFAVMRNGLWGFINHKGILVQPIRYQKIMDCSEQRCRVQLDNKWGYVDSNRKLIIKPQYYTVNQFKEGYATVKKRGQWLLINRQGYVQYRFSAKKLYSPSEGLSIFKDNNNKRGFINLRGNIVIPSQFKSAKRFSEGLAAVYNGKKWGFVNSRGKMKISFDFKNVRRFSQEIAPAKDDSGQWGYIDKSGDWVILPRFKLAYPFVNEIATVRVDNPSDDKNPYRGFINKDGSFYYEPVFEDVFQFQEGLAPVKLFGYWGFISKRLIDLSLNNVNY